MKKLYRMVLAIVASTGLLAASVPAFADENPAEIRIGYSGAGVGGKPKNGGTSLANVHARGILEEEFRKDGIKVVWNLFPGAGPSTNEAFANGKVDFGFHGDLPLIVGRATGLKHKIIIAAGRFGPVYFVVPSGSQATSLADLKGKTISTFKGTNDQLILARVLKKYGFKDSDFRVISQDKYSARAALATGDIDGTVTTPQSLEARGVAKRLIEARDDRALTAPLTIWVGEEFEKKYPHIVQRVVNALVKDAHWSSQEANRDAQYKIWAQSGIPYSDYRNDWDDASLIERHSPLLDEYFIESIKRSVAEAKEFKLIRRDVTVDDWLEPKYLNTALKDLKLDGYWPEFDAQGNRKKARK